MRAMAVFDGFYRGHVDGSHRCIKNELLREENLVGSRVAFLVPIKSLPRGNLVKRSVTIN